MQSSKAAKIWKRTWVGGLLTSALVATLWITHRVGSGWPLWIAGSALLFVCVYELGRMGKLAGRGLGWILFVPALATVLSVADATHAFYGDGDADRARWSSYARGSLLSEYAWAIAFTSIAFGFIQATRHLGRLATLARIACVVALSAWVARLVYRPDVPVEEQRTVPIAAALVAVYAALRTRSLGLDFAISIGLAAWMIVPLPSLTKVWHLYGDSGLIALSKIGDIAGYYVGSAIGKHHPFKSISPGKTTEGCIGSLIAGVLGGVAAVHWDLLPRAPLGLAGGALAGAAINLAAQAGDLFESWVKRRAGVKDASTWFGPSGGMLDLVDSLLFSIPAALWAWPRIFSEGV